MNQHPDVFDSLFVSMVHVGKTGKLEDAFIQLSGYIEREQKRGDELNRPCVIPCLY